MKQPTLICCAVLTFTALTGCGDNGGGGGLGSFSRGFAFVRDRDIYVADDSDTNVSHPLELTTSADNQNPSLSKDGRQAVFVRGGAELWMVTTTNGMPSRLLAADSSRTNLRTPVFSPDGTTVAFAYDSGGISYLATVSANGTGQVSRLTSSNSYMSPSFYPDGTAVLAVKLSSQLNYDQLVRVPLNGTMPQPVVTSLGSDACSIENRVAVSPDGTKATFDARTHSGGTCIGPVRIFVVGLPGGSPVRLTDYVDPATDGFPTWVGNNQVGYSSDFGGADEVYLLSTSAGMSPHLKIPTASQPYYGPNN